MTAVFSVASENTPQGLAGKHGMLWLGGEEAANNVENLLVM